MASEYKVSTNYSNSLHGIVRARTRGSSDKKVKIKRFNVLAGKAAKNKLRIELTNEPLVRGNASRVEFACSGMHYVLAINIGRYY